MPKKTKADPTGQRVNRAKLTRKLDARLEKSRREIIALFRAIPRDRSTETVIINKTQAVYSYDITPEQTEDLNTKIQAIINENLLETQGETMPPMWWYKPDIEVPYRQGTIEEVRDFNQLITAAIVASFFKGGIEPQLVSPVSVLTSQPYLTALRGVYVENFQQIKSLSTTTANQVIRQLGVDMQAGLTPTEIAKNITGRFDVSKSSAKRIAETEVNRAYNNSKLDAVDVAAKQSGLKAGVIHISALTATTRETHAARHGNAYTPTDQRQWWDSGSNRINCFIPSTEVQGRFVGGLKSSYRGEVIKLVTRNGRNLTVTPNHKIMTDGGLVAAAKLSKGDNLLAYSVKDKNTIRVTDLDINETNSRIDNIFASLLEIGNSSMVRPVSVDFNGDERFVDKDINTVFTKRPLTVAMNTGPFEALDYLNLKHTNAAPVGYGAKLKSLLAVLSSPSGIMGVFGVLKSFIASHVDCPVYRCLTSPPLGGSTLLKYPGDNAAADSEIKCESLDRLPANVLLDEIASVDVGYFSGHVYDLQEVSGLIIANGLIASNCKCSVESVLLDSKGQVVEKEEQLDIKNEGREFFAKQK